MELPPPLRTPFWAPLRAHRRGGAAAWPRRARRAVPGRRQHALRQQRHAGAACGAGSGHRSSRHDAAARLALVQLLHALHQPAAHLGAGPRRAVPSLLELGFERIGIDGGWMACGAGVGGSWHTAAGRPLVNETLFPDLFERRGPLAGCAHGVLRERVRVLLRGECLQCLERHRGAPCAGRGPRHRCSLRWHQDP